MAADEAWIDLMLARSAELRRAGILSIACGNNSAVFAPAEPDASDAAADEVTPDAGEPANPYENPTSYPTGNVPSFGDVEDADELPAIPTFEDA